MCLIDGSIPKTIMTTTVSTSLIEKMNNVASDMEKSAKRKAELEDLRVFMEVYKANGFEMSVGGQGHPALIGRKIDKDMIAGFKSQIKTLDSNILKTVNLMNKRILTSTIEKVRVPRKTGAVDALSLPTFVTDTAKEFFSSVNLGNIKMSDYCQDKHRDGLYVDGRDANAIKAFHQSVYPGAPLSQEEVSNMSVLSQLPLLTENNVANGGTISHLLSLFVNVNKLQSSGKVSRIHTTPEFMELIFNKKISFVVKGKDLLEGVNLSMYETTMKSLLERGTKAEENKKFHHDRCKTWKRVDVIPPMDKNSDSCVLHSKHTYKELNDAFSDSVGELKAVTKEASDFLLGIFKGEKEQSSPFSIIKKLLNVGKTYGEVFNSYSAGKSSAFVPEADAPEGSDVWGLSNTMKSVLKAYFMPHPLLIQARLDSDYVNYLKKPEVIEASCLADKTVKDLALTFKN